MGETENENKNDVDIGWNCLSCTFLNDSSSSSCTICGAANTKNASWICGVCTFENMEETASCRMCGGYNSKKVALVQMFDEAKTGYLERMNKMLEIAKNIKKDEDLFDIVCAQYPEHGIKGFWMDYY